MTRSPSRWIAALLFLSLIGSFVSAATVTITWVNPTQNTDNTAIPDTGAGSLQSWRFEYGTCLAGGAFGTKVGEFPRTRAVGGPSLTTTTNNFDPGQTCLRGYTTNTYGVESAVSNVVSKTVTPPQPGPIQLAATPLSGLNIPLDSLDGFKRTPVFSITANGPGVLMGFCKVSTPAASDPVFTYLGQTYCKPLLNHPRTGAENIAWVKDVTPAQKQNAAAPCA